MKDYFGTTVEFNEGLERWVATDNRTKGTIGYGESSMEALMDYLSKKVLDEPKASEIY